MTPQQKKKLRLKDLCKDLEVTIKGDDSTIIEGVCTIQDAIPNHLTFLMNPLYKKYLTNTKAAAVILSASDANECPVTAIISNDPYFTYAKLASFFDDKPFALQEIHSSAIIGEHCEIDKSVSIGPNAVVGNHVKLAKGVNIGPGCYVGDFSVIDEYTHLAANVTLYHKIKIGKRVQIASGVVLGADGFGIAKHKGVWLKVPQLGSVVIGDDVEIGANTAIDRGAIEDTIIENGVKLDNLIQIGHNVRIGENTAVAGCTGIAGSTEIGKNCLIGGNAGIAGHLKIADNVVITGMSEISKSIRTPGVYSTGVGGVMDNLERRKMSAYVHRIEKLVERVKILEKTFEQLFERDNLNE